MATAGSIGRMTQPARSNKPWIIAGIAAALVLAACGTFGIVFLFSGDGLPSGPPVTITACEHRDDETRLEFTVSNPGTEATPYRLRFRILDAGGREISIGTEYVTTLDPGDTTAEALTLRHVGKVGASCEYVGTE